MLNVESELASDSVSSSDTGADGVVNIISGMKTDLTSSFLLTETVSPGQISLPSFSFTSGIVIEKLFTDPVLLSCSIFKFETSAPELIFLDFNVALFHCLCIDVSEI